MENDKEFLILSWAYYDQNIWYARHYFPTALSKYSKVVYIEKEPSLISFLKYPEEFDRIFEKKDRNKHKNGNLSIYSPLPRLPFDRLFPIINKINRIKLAREISRFMNSSIKENLIILTFDFTALPLIKKIPHSFSIYYCVDEILGYNMDICRKDVINEMERSLVKEVDLTIVVSDYLFKKHQKDARRLLKITHGIDSELFGFSSSVPTIENLQGINKPIIGFLGKIARNPVDIELMKFILSKRSQYSFVFVGPPLDNTVRELAKFNNFYHIQPVPKERIADYIRSFDVCIVPYVRNVYTQGMNSLKLIQYLSQGKPIVCTDYPEVTNISELIYIAKSPEQFVSMIDVALSENNLEKQIIPRVQFAKDNTWDSKVLNLLSYLNNI
ncbi:MAG: glycosyltransferase [Bacteroidetes bacterium]|nr:glycosyltransferase [Bacteroidota bacterium]